MSPAFQNKNFLTLPEIRSTEPLYSYKVNKISVNTSFKTKFSVRSDKLKELLSFYNVAVRALSEKNSYTKIIGVAGEGGIGKSRLVYEFIKKIEKEKFVKVIKINYSDKNNFVFTKDYENLKNYFDSNFLESYKKNLPAIVIFEDLHWYDAKEKSKIEKLLFAFSGELPVPFLLSSIFILTYRETNSSFGFKKYDSFEEILLNPFNDKEASQFIRNSTLNAGKKLSLRVLEKIIRLSAGIPFYLEEFLKSFGKYKKIDSIPESVENLLDYKFSFISEDFIKILDIIAIWDGSIEKEILENICDKIHVVLPSQKYIDNTGIVKAEKNKNVVSYLFNHDIYKSYVHNKIDKNWEILLHKSIAGILKKLKEQSEHTLYRLFYHCKHAEEFEQAYDFLEKYLNNIIEQREFEIALQHLDELMEYYAKNEYKKLEIWLMKIKCLRELIRRDEMGKELEMIEKFIYKYKTSELYLKYLYQLEEFYLLSNDFTRAFRIIGKGLKLSRQLMNVQMEAEFQFVLTRNCNANGKIKDSIKEAKKLLVVSEENNFKNLYYWANYFMASNFQLLGNYAQSNLIIERSLYEININGYSQLVKNFINLKGKCFFLKGDYRSFITILKDLYKIERNDGSMHAAIVTLLNLANCLIMINEFNEARFIFNKIQTFMQKSESPLFLKRVTEGFFNLYLREDDYQRAEHISVQLLNLYGKNDYRNLALLHSNLIIIYSCLNKPKEYKKNYLRAIYYEKKTGHVSGTIVCHYNIGNAYYLSGQVTEAERYFRRAYNLMKKHFEKNYNFEINFSLAEIYLVKGKLNFAQKILNDIEECFENTKEIAHKQFYVIFYKLLINSRNQKNYEQFLNSEIFAKFLSNGDVIYVNKLKILYFTLIVNQINDLKVRPSRLKHIKNLVNLNYNSKNKIILFYLNQIPK